MTGQQILCVEDDRAILRMMCEFLRLEGYHPKEWPEGDTAYEEIVREPPALVILDVRMKRHDSGLRILRMVRADPRTRAVPIILCSANVTFFEDHAREIALLGCDTMEKPFLIDDLLACIYRCIGTPHPGAMGAGAGR